MTEIPAQNVPYIQASDINDGDILQQTRKLAVGNGIQLEFTLPSGQVLKSDVLEATSIGKAMIGWCNAVKERIVEDAASAADAAARKTRESQLGSQRSLDDFIPKTEPTAAELRAAGVPDVRQPPVEPTRESSLPRAPVPVPGESPKKYAQRMVKELKAARKLLVDGIKQRQEALAELETTLGEWERVVTGLTKPRARRDTVRAAYSAT